MTNQRLHSLDLLRGVMMWLGLVLHSAQMYMSTDLAVDYYQDPQRSIVMDVLFIVINTFRMPVFYVLTGYFTAMLLTRRGLKGMLDNRIQRILIPFALFLPPVMVAMTALHVAGTNVLAAGHWGLDMRWVADDKVLLDRTHHLWFLYYLILFVATASLVCWLRGSPDDRVSKPVTARTLFLFAASLAVIGSFSETGRISPEEYFIPSPAVYIYFGLCFLFGWVCYNREGTLQVFESRGWRAMGVAWLSFIAGGAAFGVLQDNTDPTIGMVCRIILPAASGLSVTAFVVAFIGLFQRYLSGYSPLGRYISDSSYWVFLSHLPFQVTIAIAISALAWPAIVKFLIVLVTSTAFSLITYDLWVRNGRLGEILNGRRYERGLPQADAVT